jgi:hypothetical protein
MSAWASPDPVYGNTQRWSAEISALTHALDYASLIPPGFTLTDIAMGLTLLESGHTQQSPVIREWILDIGYWIICPDYTIACLRSQYFELQFDVTALRMGDR